MTVISSKDCFNKNEPFRQMVTYLQQEQLDLIGSMHMRYLLKMDRLGAFRLVVSLKILVAIALLT